MTSTASAFVLIAVQHDRSLAQLLDAQGYAVLESPSGGHALKWARTVRPDLIILDEQLPDITGTVVCRLLRADPDVGQNVPILIVNDIEPTPEQRVDALSAGAWDYLKLPADGDLALRLDAYIQAKRSVDVALADRSTLPATSLYGRGGLTRRARELGALMVRCHEPMACLVFELRSEPADPRLGTVIAHAVRVSDVVGVLNPGTFGIVAPATNDQGAVTLAHRVSAALAAATGRRGFVDVPDIAAGYDAIGTLAYTPMDPAALLARAEAAIRSGTSEPGVPWLKRHEATIRTSGLLAAAAARERRVPQ